MEDFLQKQIDEAALSDSESDIDLPDDVPEPVRNSPPPQAPLLSLSEVFDGSDADDSSGEEYEAEKKGEDSEEDDDNDGPMRGKSLRQSNRKKAKDAQIALEERAREERRQLDEEFGSDGEEYKEYMEARKRQSAGGSTGGAKIPNFDPENPFDVAMKSVKDAKRKGRERSQTEIETEASALIGLMHMAADLDLQARKAKKPAYNKLTHLDTVVKGLAKSDLLECLVEKDVCSALFQWLRPIDRKGNLPSLAIRSPLLKACERLPQIDSDHLTTSKLGSAVMFLLQHEKEIPENKKIAKRIIDSWSRAALAISNEYSHQDRSNAEVLELPKRVEMKSELEWFGSDPTKRNFHHFALRPVVPIKDYTKKPEMREVQRCATKVLGNTQSSIKKRIDDIKKNRKDKGASRAVTVRLNGR